MLTFNVLFSNVTEIAARFEKINAKCDKYSLERVKLEFGEPYVDPKTKLEYVTLNVIGCYPTVGDYTLIGVLEKFDDESNVVRLVPGKEMPEQYRSTKFSCDHCGINRFRKEVVIVQNIKTGEYKQVGKTCLKDYLGDSFEKLVYIFDSIIDSMEDMDKEFCGGSYDYVCSTEFFLKMLHRVYKRFGYVSKSKASEEERMSTADYMVSAVFRTGHTIVKMLEDEGVCDGIEEEDEKFSANVLEWVKGIDTSNDYMYNLKLILSAEDLKQKHFGYAASSIVAFKKATEVKTEKKESNYVGKIKERIEVEVEIVSVIPKDGYWGMTTIFVFKDKDGNYFVWFGSGLIAWGNPGDKITIKGTVKDHSEYNGRKQTVLNRVKCLEFAS